ncbi:MAG: LamG domain-containing protein, partial [Nanoarchaeota archaeon]|nr:LamG domain-containing protein [Nanoarchaeota archaeon]
CSATLDGTGTQDTWGRISGTDYFDGTNDGLNCGADTSLDLNDHTYEFWFRYDSILGSWSQIIAKLATGSDRSPGIWQYTGRGCIHWRYNPGNLGATCIGPSGDDTDFLADQWYHMVGVKSGTELWIYVDGSLVGGPYTVPATLTLGGDALYIGDTSGYNPINGRVDELRVSTEIRTADWIDQSHKNIVDYDSFISVGEEEEATKGIISTIPGTIPFWTSPENPQYASATSCLNSMKKDDTCQTTWTVNATGEIGSVWEFYAIYAPDNYDAYLESNETDRINITIVDQVTPVISGLECQLQGGSWIDCTEVVYNNVLSAVRAQCSYDLPGPVYNMTFRLDNIDDDYNFFANVTQDNSTGYWTYDFDDFTVKDSGIFNLSMSCAANTTGYDDTEWSIPFGNYAVNLLPYTDKDISVISNRFFTFNSNVSCADGECGYTNVTLDPSNWDNYSFSYRRVLNISEANGIARINTHFKVDFSLSSGILSVGNEDGTVMYCDGIQVPWDGYSVSDDGSWITQFEGIAEINLSASQSVECYIYMDPVSYASEKLPTNTGWGFAHDDAGSDGCTIDIAEGSEICTGTRDAWDLTSSFDIDGSCSVLGSDGEDIDVNTWCYFKGEAASESVWKIRSGDYSEFYVNGSFVQDNRDEASTCGGQTQVAFYETVNGGGWSGTYDVPTGQYIPLKAKYRELSGSNIFEVYWDCDDNGNNENGCDFIDSECYPYLGDGWEITVSVGATESSKDIIPMTAGATPFYTTYQNPITGLDTACLADMKAGESCIIDWEVNATGEIGSSYWFYVESESLNYSSNIGIQSSTKIRVTIVNNTLPVVNYTYLLPDYPETIDDLTCYFNVTDYDAFENITVNLTWFRDGSVFSSSILYVSHSIEYSDAVSSVNTTEGETWICSVTPFDITDQGSTLNSTPVSIVADAPPTINSIQCQENNSVWGTCDMIGYGDYLTQVRVNCTDTFSTTNASFRLENLPDNYGYFNNTITELIDGYYTYNFGDIQISDSGSFNLNVICRDNASNERVGDSNWTVPWGSLQTTIFLPTGDVNVSRYGFFTWQSEVACSGGECGGLNATIDPAAGWWNTNWSRRKEITITNIGSSVLSDFTAYINVSYDEDMLANFDDIRFVNGSCASDSTQELNYEIEYRGSDYADIWVKIPSLDVTGASICMYYGNSDASNNENREDAWQDDYIAVWHKVNESDSDSTRNDHDPIAVVEDINMVSGAISEA